MRIKLYVEHIKGAIQYAPFLMFRKISVLVDTYFYTILKNSIKLTPISAKFYLQNVLTIKLGTCYYLNTKLTWHKI